MNTARAFGPAVVSGFTEAQWVWWLGPTIGSLLASALYTFFKATKYWRLNPDQVRLAFVSRWAAAVLSLPTWLQDTADHTESPDLFTSRSSPNVSATTGKQQPVSAGTTKVRSAVAADASV